VNLELTETQTLIRDTARKFARERVAPQARTFDRQEIFPVELFKELASLGLMGVNIRGQYGGAEAGVISYALAMMEMAAACASTSVAMAVTNMCAELIEKFGTEAQRQKYVTRITSGEAVVGAFALSEPHAGSDPRAMRTTAVRRGDKYVLNGSKQWITSGAYAGVMVVWAQTGGQGGKGISAFIVEGGTKGLIVGKHEDKMGLRGSNTVGLTFEDMEIPAENLLGKEGDGFKLAMIALDDIVVMPAATDTTNRSAGTWGASSASSAAMSCGFTVRISVSALAAASAVESTSTAYRARRTSARSGRRAVTTTSAGDVPLRSMPESSASPILPVPSTATGISYPFVAIARRKNARLAGRSAMRRTR